MAAPVAAADAATVTKLKQKVAACVRLLHMEGIVNYSGHVSARLPDGRGFVIQPYIESRVTLRAEHLLELDFDLHRLLGSRPEEMPIETRIHSEIYKARPDVQAVVHTHSELAAAFTVADAKLLPMKSHAARWASGIPVHADPSHIKSEQQGRELAATLGQHQAALLRAHGGVCVAESVEALLIDAVHFEENARAQVQARAIGPLLPLTQAELELLISRSNRDQHIGKLWRYYVGKGLSEGALEDCEGLLGDY
ncbi:MAG TPA: class II aldolase/adducin family protein [Chloroflexota bacterium]|nr:class II aldolase/adducin family protein [Chloroflexota bacterium]